MLWFFFCYLPLYLEMKLLDWWLVYPKFPYTLATLGKYLLPSEEIAENPGERKYTGMQNVYLDEEKLYLCTWKSSFKFQMGKMIIKMGKR